MTSMLTDVELGACSKNTHFDTVFSVCPLCTVFGQQVSSSQLFSRSLALSLASPTWCEQTHPHADKCL